MQEHILDVMETATLHPFSNERFKFRLINLNGRGVVLLCLQLTLKRGDAQTPELEAIDSLATRGGRLRQGQLRFTSPKCSGSYKDEMERLASQLKLPKIDESQAAAQLDKVLTGEREIKHAQLMLLVRIKNSLSGEQQNRLREFSNKSKSR